MPDTPYKFDKAAFEKRIAEIKDYQITTYSGKKGVNPHQWLWDNLKPIEDLYNANSKNETKELFDRLMALNYKVQPDVKGPNKFDGSNVVNRG